MFPDLNQITFCVSFDSVFYSHKLIYIHDIYKALNLILIHVNEKQIIAPPTQLTDTFGREPLHIEDFWWQELE